MISLERNLPNDSYFLTLKEVYGNPVKLELTSEAIVALARTLSAEIAAQSDKWRRDSGHS